MKIQSLRNQAWIADQCLVAESFFDRLKGLLGKQSLEPGHGLMLTRCNNIHMWFMSISIDVVFIQRVSQTESVWNVTSVRSGCRPWTLFPIWDNKATETLELPVGTIQRCDIQKGDRLCIS